MKVWLSYLLWASSPVSQVAIATVMLRRRLHREFPMFFSYTVFRATTALLILVLFGFHILPWGRLYYNASWLHEAGCILLRFAIIYELIQFFSRAYSDLKKSSIELFGWGASALCVLSVIIAFSLRTNPPNDWIDAGLNMLDRSVDVVQVGLLLAIILLVRYLCMSWQSYSFGIALGLGIFAAVDLITSAVLAQSGAISTEQQKHLTGIVDLINLASYQVCALIWLVYALLPERAPKLITTIPEHDLDSWNHELERLLQR